MNNPKTFYRRNLPHYQPPDGTFFVTYRLAGSLPLDVIIRLREERVIAERRISAIRDPAERAAQYHVHQYEYFEKFDALLDGDTSGPVWLKQNEVASVVKESLHYHDQRNYDLIAFTIMSNHVHMICSLLPEAVREEVLASQSPSAPYVLTTILQSIKKYSAREANKIIKRHGQFWTRESYDHVIRDDDELERLVWYVLNNPVKAGLCASWEEWKWTYVREGVLE